MNIVIGATGIVGSNVLYQLLQNNQPVTACKQSSSDISKVETLFSYYSTDFKNLFAKIKWINADVNDLFSLEEALEGVSNVYYCAGFVSFNKKNRDKLFLINEKGTTNIVTACLSKKIDMLCYVSSIATINNLDYTQALNESVFWKKSGKESDYAISKYNGEREVWRGIEEGLNAVIVNPGVILSPGFRNQSSSKLFDIGNKGNKFYTNGTSGYIDARDLAKIMLHLVCSRIVAHRYIVIENNYSYKTIFDLINTGFHKKPSSISISKKTLTLISYLEIIYSKLFFRKRKLHSALINSAFSKQNYSNKKLLEVYKAPLLKISESIDEICKMYLKKKSSKTN
jgi:dihydroflavonol-4-reductase